MHESFAERNRDRLELRMRPEADEDPLRVVADRVVAQPEMSADRFGRHAIGEALQHVLLAPTEPVTRAFCPRNGRDEVRQQ